MTQPSPDQVVGEETAPPDLLGDLETLEAEVCRVSAVLDGFLRNKINGAVELTQEAQPRIVHGYPCREREGYIE